MSGSGKDNPSVVTSTKDSGGGLSNSILEWSASVRCKKFEVDVGFSLFVFLGEVPHDPRLWLFDPAFCGTFDVLGGDVPNKDQAELILNGAIHLNYKILERSGKKSLEPDVVVPYLKDNINWGIVKVRYQLHERKIWYFSYCGTGH
jgi:hypothetical protein